MWGFETKNLGSFFRISPLPLLLLLSLLFFSPYFTTKGLSKTKRSGTMQPQPHQPDSKFYKYRNYNTLFLLYFVYVAFVSSRRPFGVVRRTMEQEEGLTTWQLGMIDTAFLGMYMIGQTFYGEVKHYVSPRNTIATSLIVVAFSLWAFSMSSGFYAFFFLWALNGIANSPGWPTCIRVLTPWIRPEERGRIMGMWASCQAAGGVVGNGVTAYFLGASGWRIAVAQSSVLVGVIGVASWKFMINHPTEVGYADQEKEAEEVESPRDEKEDGHAKEKDHLGPLQALRVPGVTPVAIAHFCEKMIRYTLLFWLPYYLTKRLHYDDVVSGYAASAFDIGGVVGSIASGIIADSFAGGKRRMFVCVCFLSIGGLSLLPFALFTDLFMSSVIFPVVSSFIIGFFLLGFDSLITTAVLQDLAQKGGVSKHVSSISGVIGGSGAFGSLLQGPLTTMMTATFNWEVLWVTLVMLVVTASCTLVPSAYKV